MNSDFVYQIDYYYIGQGYSYDATYCLVLGDGFDDDDNYNDDDSDDDDNR
jgi:hypothetical protein